MLYAFYVFKNRGDKVETILEYLSENIKIEIEKYLGQANKEEQIIEEIRLRANRKMAVKISNRNIILEHIVTIEEMLETFQKVCEHSIYSYQKQICEGFITIKGGHRVGLSGSCVLENGKIINVNYISSLNFRIAREKKDCSNKILNYVITNEEVANTLIVSKPGCGKTTMLRDLLRKISSGIPEFSLSAKTCGIVDERGEIASMYKGIPQNDIGNLSDIISNCSKAQGMQMLIRSMAPEIIACDEIGSKEDIEAINYAMCSGVKGIFTVHGNTLEEILLNSNLKDLIEKNIIEVIIFLDEKNRGNIKKVYSLNRDKKSYIEVTNNGSK